jgi:hypothetical protein
MSRRGKAAAGVERAFRIGCAVPTGDAGIAQPEGQAFPRVITSRLQANLEPITSRPRVEGKPDGRAIRSPLSERGAEGHGARRVRKTQPRGSTPPASTFRNRSIAGQSPACLVSLCLMDVLPCSPNKDDLCGACPSGDPNTRTSDFRHRHIMPRRNIFHGKFSRPQKRRRLRIRNNAWTVQPGRIAGFGASRHHHDLRLLALRIDHPLIGSSPGSR